MTVTAAKKRVPVRKSRTKAPDTGVERERKVAEAAYFLAQSRGFAPGSELDDWLRAEAVVDGHWLKV